MKKDYYSSPKSDWITRMLWRAAGADEYILNKATYWIMLNTQLLAVLFALQDLWLLWQVVMPSM